MTTKYTTTFSVLNEDSDELAIFFDRFDAAIFMRSLPWWDGDCRIKTNHGAKMPAHTPWWVSAS